MYYYPYYLHLINWWSFKHYNTLDTSILPPKQKSIALWSITRIRGGGKRTHVVEYVAYYNYYTMDYEFGGQRYLCYNDVVNQALK
jgi:hypothetical protein